MLFIDTFADAEQYLARRYAVSAVDPACVEFDCEAADCVVRVEFLEARGACWLAVAAEVGPEVEIDPWTCLAHNACLLVGGLAVDTEKVWMRTVLPLGTTSEGLDEAVAYVVEQAALVRAPVRAEHGGLFGQHED